MTAAYPRTGTLLLSGWGGLTHHPITVVGETATRYRIQAERRTKLPGRGRWLEPGTTASVPKESVQFEAPTLPTAAAGLCSTRPPLNPPSEVRRGALDTPMSDGQLRTSLQAFEAPIEELHRNPGQPRTRFNEAALNELAASLKELTMLEPILVRRRARGGYEIVAGERRWRAAQRAGLRSVPIVVRELSDTTAFEAALVENLQREDLNPLETARAYDRLIAQHGLSLTRVAQRVGKSLATVANTHRLLQLPPAVQSMIEDGVLSEGHGRALLSAREHATIEAIAREAVTHAWSVRQTERRTRATAPRPQTRKSANVRDLEERLARTLHARVQLDEREADGQKGGTITITYSNLDDLDRLLNEVLLTREKP